MHFVPQSAPDSTPAGTEIILPSIQTPIFYNPADARVQVRHDAYRQRSQSGRDLGVADEAARGEVCRGVAYKRDDDHNRRLFEFGLIDDEKAYGEACDKEKIPPRG